jgi:hypothetical protein
MRMGLKGTVYRRQKSSPTRVPSCCRTIQYHSERIRPPRAFSRASALPEAGEGPCEAVHPCPRRQPVMVSAMVIIAFLLCLVTLLKLISISNAIRWLGGDAARYRKDVIKNRPQTVFALEVILQVWHANFFPFGLKDYRLAAYMRNLPRRSVRGTAAWWVLAVFQKVFFQFQGLALASAVFFVLGAHASPKITWVPHDVYGGVGAALGILLMIGIVLLACESFTSYVVLGSYGAAFHRLDVRRRHILDEAAKPSTLLPQPEDRNLAIIEMFAYAGIFLSAFMIMACATYFISVQLGGFSALHDPIGAGLIDGRRLFDAFYWTVNIAGGSSEAGPVTMLAMLLAMIGTITYLLLTVIVLAALAGIVISAPGKSD